MMRLYFFNPIVALNCQHGSGSDPFGKEEPRFAKHTGQQETGSARNEVRGRPHTTNE